MILSELIEEARVIKSTGSDNIDINGISLDSNKVEKGFLFIALKGERTDGHKYIGSAVSNGASAIVLEKVPDIDLSGVTVIEVPDSREALASISASYYANPTKELTLVGVTGTNGKTTITYMIESIWKQEKLNSAVLGTIDYRYGGRSREANMTTPESIDLMRMFREMRNEGVEAAVMEVSSHAIDKKRVNGCQFDASVFTNLTQDHLDYHGTIENYLNTKKKLFTELLRDSDKKNKYSIINMDDPYGKDILREAVGELVSYSAKDPKAAVFAESSRITDMGIEASVRTPWGRVNINSKLFGAHNLSNLLAACAAAVSLGASIENIEKGLSRISAIPGRLESIENPLGINVLVDYAHTPDALENVLKASKPLTSGRLILVFGCGGDRDITKRPKMGLIGRELSDILIVTSDNPRTESPEKILDDIEKGVISSANNDNPYIRISDRKEAIEKALEMARENDTVLIAGKGHEDYQIIGKKKFPFDDREIARQALKSKIN